jgi:hypothetical protein
MPSSWIGGVARPQRAIPGPDLRMGRRCQRRAHGLAILRRAPSAATIASDHMDVFQFQSFNLPECFIRHHNFLGELSREVVGMEREFAFKLVDRGQDAKGRRLVTLRSVFPEHHSLRHRDFRLHLEKSSGPADQLFRQDSTFFLEPGLAAPDDHNALSFRSFNFPDRYIRHRDFHLFVEPRDSANLVPDATFIKTVRID